MTLLWLTDYSPKPSHRSPTKQPGSAEPWLVFRALTLSEFQEKCKTYYLSTSSWTGLWSLSEESHICCQGSWSSPSLLSLSELSIPERKDILELLSAWRLTYTKTHQSQNISMLEIQPMAWVTLGLGHWMAASHSAKALGLCRTFVWPNLYCLLAWFWQPVPNACLQIIWNMKLFTLESERAR